MLMNVLYSIVLCALSPWLLWRGLRTGRYRRDLRAKLTGRVSIPASQERTVWFHGVSVGEIHLLATLIDRYRQRHPDHRIVVSSTTDTGLAEARKRFDHVIAWPFDFTWAVANALDAVKPDFVVLAEGEMWPNFLKCAERRGTPVVVVNARLSPRSYRRYQRVARLARRLLLSRVRVIAVQDDDYAERFRSLGVGDVRVTGSIKYDGALKPRDERFVQWHSRDAERSAVWVAGSTHAPEEQIILDAFRRLRTDFPELRLILVPRHPDRFDEVAALIESTAIPFTRRSRTDKIPATPIVLLDTVGELGAAWSIADFGYVGGTLDGQRGGQSMIEPAGFGVPCVFGPHVWNFADAARRLVDGGGAVMVPDAAAVAAAVANLLWDEDYRRQVGAAARRFVESQQGATQRTLDIIDEQMQSSVVRRAA